MNRLLQGDVGSGKTVVAALALPRRGRGRLPGGAHGADRDPRRAARAHARRAPRAARRRRWRSSRTATRGTERQTLRAALAAGEIASRASAPTRSSRKASSSAGSASPWSTSSTASASCSAPTLRGKGRRPDVLVMTATPIPRTLALTLLRRPRRVGDRRAAAGPHARSARVRARRRASAREIYDVLRDEMRAGRQAYVVYPLVEESETLRPRDATTEWRTELARERVPEVARRAPARADDGATRRTRSWTRFRAGELDILVSTTVIEVGIDVPNAIGDADRARRALRAVAAPPAPRPRRPRALRRATAS